MDIVNRVGIKAPASEVYTALPTIEGLAAWWTRDTTGGSKVGSRIDFRFHDSAGRDVGGFGMDVLELTPQQSVRWRVNDGPQEWVDTDIEFLISREDDYTIVMFSHRKWREQGPFMAHCTTKWATFLLSLREFVETGQGRPAPDDVKVSNWH